ncbi:S-layer homology domain-containing protein [Patescibacteria group bacterium]|nr:S-layer homology domain-containing protein [Patescibacteria group bacterium]MBU1016159.1 S-layer homology domain-containing protein [Patescibacteria group bacterium]MBU1684707.1 S-layer homology domain-containing protein [Patescibacteria group bacterium]
MRQKIIFVLTALITLTGMARAVSASFSDVPEDAWYASYVDSLKEAGIVDAGEFFRPQDSLKRAELVKMVITATGGLKDHTPPPYPTFDDVQPGEWYTNYIEAAATLGIVTGYADAQGNLIGLFGPGDTVNRAAAVKMLVEAFGLKQSTEDAKKYPDVKESDWFYDYVLIAGQHGVVSGYDNGRFGPADPVTRAQVAKMVVLGAQTAGFIEKPEPAEEEQSVTQPETAPETKEAEEEAATDTTPLATPNLNVIEEANTPAGSDEVFVARYTFRALYEDFSVQTVTIVNDITGSEMGDEAEGTAAIKNVILKFPDKDGKPVTEKRSLGSDGKARFSNLTFYAMRNEETFFEVYAELNSIADVGEGLSGEVFRLGLQDTNNNDSSFRAVGELSGYTVGYGGSRLSVSGSQVQPFTVRKSVPHFSMNDIPDTMLSGMNSLISFNVAADAAGSVSLARLVLELSVYDNSGSSLSLSDFRLYRGSSYMNNVNIYDATGSQDLTLAGGGSLAGGTFFVIVTFDQEEIVSAGDSLNFLLKATVNSADKNDSVSTGFARDDENSPLSGLTAVNQPNTGKVFVNGDATAGIFTGVNDFAQNLGTGRNIIWSDRSANLHLFPTVSGGLVTSGSGSADWTNGYLLELSALEDHTISK